MRQIHLKALIIEIALVPWAFVGIVLYLKFQQTNWFAPAMLIWGLFFVLALVWAVWMTIRSRKVRVDHASHRPHRT